MLPPSPLQRIDLPDYRAAGVRLYVKRDDRYAFRPGSPLQGNKVRKLAALLEQARTLSPGHARAVVSFGGAYSNHVAALATAGHRFGFATYLVIRGEEVSNPVLDYVRELGAQLRFVSRTAYRSRALAAGRAQLTRDWWPAGTDPLYLPEGGTTAASLAGTAAIYTETVAQLGHAPDYFCLGAGTGGTAAGVARAAAATATRVEVYPALWGDWLGEEIRRLGGNVPFHLVTDYHYGGYAKFPAHWQRSRPTGALASRADVGITGLPPLEPVYTAKLFTGVLDRLGRGHYPPDSTVVIYHSGGIY